MMFGDDEIEETQFDWAIGPDQPLPMLYMLEVGQHLRDAPLSDQQKEHFVLCDGESIPVGAAICRHLAAHMKWIYFTETWGGRLRLFDGGLMCCPIVDPWATVVRDLISANGGLGGFPDVVGERHDGQILLCEAKAIVSNDRLRQNQHAFVRAARARLGSRLELMVARWG